MPLSALSTMSLPLVQTVIEFTNRIPKIMVQFCYLRLYFGIDNVSRRLLQWIARIEIELAGWQVGRTCMSMSERSVRDHDWCVWIYETGVIFNNYSLSPNGL